jgi:hypothetical protein
MLGLTKKRVPLNNFCHFFCVQVLNGVVKKMREEGSALAQEAQNEAAEVSRFVFSS